MGRLGDAVWAAARDLWPDGADVEQQVESDLTRLVIRPSRQGAEYTRPIAVRISKGAVAAMRAADDATLAGMATRAAAVMRGRLAAYDPDGLQGAAFTIDIDEAEIGL